MPIVIVRSYQKIKIFGCCCYKGKFVFNVCEIPLKFQYELAFFRLLLHLTNGLPTGYKPSSNFRFTNQTLMDMKRKREVT